MNISDILSVKISSLRDHENHNSEEKRSSFCDSVGRILLQKIVSVDWYFKVLRRDRYTCAVTGYQDLWHPKPDRSKGPKVRLDAAHIFSWPMSRDVSICVGHLSILPNKIYGN